MRSGLALGAWRSVIAACGFVGFGFAVATFHDPWQALSQQASLLTGIVYLALAFVGVRAARVVSWFRGALAVLLLLVCGTYLTVIEGDLDSAGSLFEHLLTPLVVVVDWVFVGRSRVAVRWWYPLSWVLFPLLYLVYFLLADVQLYRGFLNPDAGDFGPTVGAFLVAVVATGYLLYGVVRQVRVVAVAEAT